MSIIILLNSLFLHWFDYYHFNDFKTDVTFIAICGKKFKHKLSDQSREYFEEVYFVDNTATEDDFIESLDVSSVKAIITSIVHRNPQATINIVTVDEGSVDVAALMRSEFHLTGLQAPQGEMFRNKWVMKDVISQAKIPMPKGCLFEPKKMTDSSAYYTFLRNYLNTPFIVKPVASAGSAGVKKIASLSDFIGYFSQINTDMQYLIEAYLVGNMYCADLVLHDKNVIFVAIEKYTHPQMMIAEGCNIGIIPLMPNNATHKKCAYFAKRVLQALDNPNGIFHLEMFIHANGNFSLLEMAARAPGGLSVPCIEDCFGVNLFDLELAEILNQKYKPKRVDYFSCYVIVPKIQGILTQFNLPRLRSQTEVHWMVNLGNQLSNSTSLADAAGLIKLINKDYAELYQDFFDLNHLHFLIMNI